MNILGNPTLHCLLARKLSKVVICRQITYLEQNTNNRLTKRICSSLRQTKQLQMVKLHKIWQDD